MTETISQIIRNGFQTWKSNLGIPCISFAWNFIVMMIISMSLITLFLPIFTAPPLSMIFTDPESFNNLTSDEISAMTAETMENLSFSDFIVPGIIIIVCLILVTMAGFFVMGGLYAMIRDATRNGKCSYATFLRECRRNFFRIIAAWLLSLVIIFIIKMIFWFIGFTIGFVLGLTMSASGSSEYSFMMMLSAIIQIPISIIEFLLIYLVSFLIYGVVIEKDKSISDSLNSSFSFMRHNMKDVMKLGLIIACIYILIILFYLVFIFFPFMVLFIWVFMFLLMFVVGPLTDIWSVRLYMDRSNMIGAPEGGYPAGGISGSAGSCISDDGLTGAEPAGASAVSGSSDASAVSGSSDASAVSGSSDASAVSGSSDASAIPGSSDASGQPVETSGDDDAEKIYVDENGRIIPRGPPDYPELGGYNELKR